MKHLTQPATATFGSGEQFEVSHLQLWARLALGAAVALVGLGVLGGFYGMSLVGGGDHSRALGVLDVLGQVIAVLAMLANLLAFSLALACWSNGANKVPWVVLSISGLGVCYCVFLVVPMLLGVGA